MTDVGTLLNIRYIKLHFTLELCQDCTLPQHKASALRGGMGEMLLRANCIRDRKCESCDFEPECIVQRTMYSKFDTVKPSFITTGDSSGYVLSCEDRETDYRKGDTLRFCLTLFGKTAVYFNLYMQAFYSLGMHGIGRNHSRFRIISVLNSTKEPILGPGGDLFMEKYQIRTVGDYVRHRETSSGITSGEKVFVNINSPLALKHNGEQLSDYDIRVMAEAVLRRLYILNCFENHDIPEPAVEEDDLPVILSSRAWDVEVPRYSNRQHAAMLFHGLIGSMTLDHVSKEMLKLLFAGEILHIGRNTSFGFGRYTVSRITTGEKNGNCRNQESCY